MALAIAPILWSCQPEAEILPSRTHNLTKANQSVFDAKVQELVNGGLVQLDTANYSLPIGYTNATNYAVFVDPSDPDRIIMPIDPGNDATIPYKCNRKLTLVLDVWHQLKKLDCSSSGKDCEIVISYSKDKNGNLIATGCTIIVC